MTRPPARCPGRVRSWRMGAFGALIALVLWIPACASSGIHSSYDHREIAFEELRQLEVSNLVEAIRQARPHWLRARTPQAPGGLETRIIVYLNGIFQGDVDQVLDTIPVDWVHRIEYLDAAQADALPGSGGGRILGAFMIYTNDRPEGADTTDSSPPAVPAVAPAGP